MRLLARFAARNLLRHRWRTLATVVGVALGVAAVLATLSVGANVEANLGGTLDVASGGADLVVVPGSSGRAVFDADDALARIADVAGVAAVRSVLETPAEPLREASEVAPTVIPGLDSGFRLFGRDTEPRSEVPADLAVGRLPEPGESGVALGAPFAEARGIGLGTTVRFAGRLGELSYTVTGLLDGTRGVGSTNGGRVGIVPLDVLQRDLRLVGRVSSLEIVAAPSVTTSQLSADLDAALGDAYVVTPPSGAGAAATGIVETLQSGLLVLAATLMALGGFMAYNTFAAAVVERRREYALLRTLCMRRRDVQRLAMIEAGLVSVAGAAMGVALGVLLAWAITSVNAAVLGFEARTLVVPTGAVAVAILVGTVVAVSAGLLPASTASRTPPLAALRHAVAGEDAAPSMLQRGLGAAALVLGAVTAFAPWPGLWTLLGSGLAMALFFVGIAILTPDILRPSLRLLAPALRRIFGLPGRLGADFARRNAERNGVAIGTVIVGVALIVGVGAMVAGVNRAIDRWVDTTVVGDLFVTGPVGFPGDFAAEVSAMDGVAEVSGVALRVVRFEAPGEPRGRSVALVLVDPARFDPDSGFGSFQYIRGQGDARSGYAALARGDVLAGNTLRERFGVNIGDTVRLRTSGGFAPFDVGGVIVDFTGGGEAFVGSIASLPRFGGGSPDLFVVNGRDGVDPGDIRRRILATYPDLALDITRTDTYQQRILDAAQRSFATTNALLVLAAIIAALGVANTLGMNLTARGHEIAVLRTLGLDRAGVRRLVLAEGIVVLLIGTILGVVVGLLLSRVVTSGASALTGYVLEPAYPWSLAALALGLAPAVGILASLAPARRAGRLAPVRALVGDA